MKKLYFTAKVNMLDKVLHLFYPKALEQYVKRFDDAVKHVKRLETLGMNSYLEL